MSRPNEGVYAAANASLADGSITWQDTGNTFLYQEEAFFLDPTDLIQEAGEVTDNEFNAFMRRFEPNIVPEGSQ